MKKTAEENNSNLADQPTQSASNCQRNGYTPALAVADSTHPAQSPLKAEKEEDEELEGWTAVEAEAELELCKLLLSLECLNNMLVTWEGQVDALWDMTLWIHGRLDLSDVPISESLDGQDILRELHISFSERKNRWGYREHT